MPCQDRREQDPPCDLLTSPDSCSHPSNVPLTAIGSKDTEKGSGSRTDSHCGSRTDSIVVDLTLLLPAAENWREEVSSVWREASPVKRLKAASNEMTVIGVLV